MRFLTWGLSGTIATERDDDLDLASERLWHWVGEVERACSRFRDDSELTTLNRRAGQTVEVSDVFCLALAAALRSERLTGGLCDPTILPSLVALGYDTDYDEVASRPDSPARQVAPAPGVGAIDFDPVTRTVRLASGTAIDLGASAKALVCDLVADELAARGGVVVEIGGDVAVRGSGPDGPWAIAVADTLNLTGHEPRVSVQGGVATSSATTRTWRSGGATVNHIVDPRTGRSASGSYATATVSAADCVTANAFATASLLWDDDAPYHVAQAGWSARLVRRDGGVEYVGGWPEDVVA
ncbi:MAG: FAD:protein FMN transferase [Acidimicrobiales bacterium]